MPNIISRLSLCFVLLLSFGQVQAQVGLAPMDAHRFTSLYIAVLSKALPDATVKRDSALRLSVTTAAGQTARIYLENPFSDYRREPEALEDILVTHMRTMVQSLARFAEHGSAIDLDEVLPMIRGRDWIEARARQTTRAGGGQGSQVFHEPLTEHLVIVYAMDRPDTIQYLRNVDLERLVLKPETLRARAMENLTRHLPTLEIHTIEGGNAALLEAGNDLESSLLLIDRIWSYEALRFGGDVVVAVPARGMLLVTGSDNAAGLAQLRKFATRIMAQDTYPLSNKLLVRRSGRFQDFD